MKLLIITQKVDKEDSILGFFHKWILELSKKFEKISVICLEKPVRHTSQGEAGGGEYNLPQNVKVFSLGKESQKSRLLYIKNFYQYITGLHSEYDIVFVHMNQEYILLGGVFWKILGKKIYFWRNHPKGNFLTRIAIWFSNKVFCTSKYAFSARFKKTKIMPVGIDVDQFKIQNSKLENENKILFLGRMSPIKKPDLLIEALTILDKQNIDFVCDFYGDPLPKDRDYYEILKKRINELKLEKKVSFFAGVPNNETPNIYSKYDIFVNLTESGSFDKTILEAILCGCVPLVRNLSLKGEINEDLIVESADPSPIASTIKFWLEKRNIERRKYKIAEICFRKPQFKHLDTRTDKRIEMKIFDFLLLF